MFYTDKVLVLMYHDIGPIESRFNISKERWLDHLDSIMKAGYNIISINNYMNFYRNGEKIPPNALLLTFDDGYESFYKVVYPELKRRGILAVNFIVTKIIDDSPSLPYLPYDQIHDYPHLSWDQMREMKRDGFSFLNHTIGNHKAKLVHKLYLSGSNRYETDEEYDQRIRNDLINAEKRITEELGEHPKVLSFPYGEHNKHVLSIGKELGFELFFTVKKGINKRDSSKVMRIDGGSPTIDGKKIISILSKYNS